MNRLAVTSPRWSTATLANAVDTSPLELRDLGAHVSRCNGCRGRLFALRCAIDAIHGFVAPRFMTTLFIAGTVIGLTTLVL
jgi:hypothetical protein